MKLKQEMILGTSLLVRFISKSYITLIPLQVLVKQMKIDQSNL